MAAKSRKTKGFKKEDVNRCWCRNKSTKNLFGERWKPVPEVEETHEVSSYGRFRCLDKVISPPDKRPYLRKGHLMSPHIIKVPNYHVKDFTYHVSIAVETKDRVFSLSIRRLVYHCFVEPIKLNDGASPEFPIIPKDGNGLNTHYRNLMKTTKSAIEKSLYHRNRIPNTLKSLSKQKRKEMAKKGTPKRFKAITQYTRHGKRIAFFPSLKAASEKTRILKPVIGNALRGRVISAGSYLWRYGHGPAKIDTGTLSHRMDNYLARVSRPITQYDLSEQRLANIPVSGRQAGKPVLIIPESQLVYREG